MFEGFTDRARRVVHLAKEETSALGHPYVGTGHILLGLVKEGGGIANQAMDCLGLTSDAIRTQAMLAIPQAAETTPSGGALFAPQVKSVLEFSLREALTSGQNYLGSEHILVGLVRLQDGAASQALLALGVDQGRLISHVRQEAENLGSARRGKDPVGLLVEARLETEWLQIRIQEMESSGTI